MSIPRDFYVVLVGEQTLPNILPALAIKPKNVWFVYTGNRFLVQEILWMKQFFQRIAHEQKEQAPNFKEIQVSAFHPDETAKKLQKAWMSAGKPKLVINLTGGTKLMAIGAYQFARECRISALYFHENSLSSMNSNQPLVTELLNIPKLGPAGILQAYGKTLSESEKAPDLTPNRLRAAEEMGRFPEAATIFGYWVRKNHKSGTPSKSTTPLYAPPELADFRRVKEARRLLKTLSDFGILESSSFTKEEPRITVLDQGFMGKHSLGVWLEWYVAGTAIRLLGKPSVMAGCHIRWNEEKGSDNLLDIAPKNELDVVLSSNNRLHYFSCKCDGQGKEMTLSKELLAIDAVGRAIGGALARKVLVTNSDASEKRELLEKARILRIDIIDRAKLPELERWLLAGG